MTTRTYEPFATRHARQAAEADTELAGMSAMEALHAGLLQRVRKYYGCPARSPESDLPCELDPGHEHAHHAHLSGGNTVAWA
jgi:hypothetical protein